MGNISISFRSHPSQEAWEKYALRQLTEEQFAPMEEHLFVCKQCRQTLDEVDNYVLPMKVGTAELLHASAESKLKRFWRAVWPQTNLPRLAWSTVTATACLVTALYLVTPRVTTLAPSRVEIISLRG